MTLAEKIAEATSENLHTLALIYKAQAMENETGDAFAMILSEIDKEHQRVGVLSPVNHMLRRGIDMKLRQYNEALGLDPEPIFAS